MASLTNGLFDNLQYWHWWVFAIVLIILEVFSPAAFFMWMGAAAGVTGLVLLAVPDMSWEIQFLLFSASSIVAILLGRTFFNRDSENVDDPTSGQLEQEMIGNIYEVEQAISNGTGRVKVGESTWKANGPDCAEGKSVRVTAVKGAELEVELV